MQAGDESIAIQSITFHLVMLLTVLAKVDFIMLWWAPAISDSDDEYGVSCREQK